jgi:hypothetical protein
MNEMNEIDEMDRMDEMDETHPNRVQRAPMHERINTICEQIKELGLTPKKFIYHFLTNTDSSVRERRGKWATQAGWSSTKQLLLTIGHLIKADKETGVKRWSHEFIIDEVRLKLAF